MMHAGSQNAFSISHPIKSTRELFRATRDFFRETLGEPRLGRTVLFAGKVTAIVVCATVLFLIPKKAEAKPPPFYKYTSVFAYLLMTPVEGMDGKETNFWVREGGISYKLPFTLSFGNASISTTAMVLGGVTRAEGLPPAETNFMKIAITPNITFGEVTLSLGARIIKAWSKPWSLKAGPMTISIPGEAFVDTDLGARVNWSRGREEPGFVRSVTLDATRFNASGTIRDPYYVYSGSIGLQEGFGFESSVDTRTEKLSVGASKAFDWGELMLIPGIGYEFGTQSAYYYVFTMVNPVSVMLAYQTEGGEKSYHLLFTVDPTVVYNWVAGNSSH